MNKKKLIPEVRFKAYYGNWKESRIKKSVENIGTGASKYNESSIKYGKYPVLGSTSVIGYDESFDYEGDFVLIARVGANAGETYRYSGRAKITDNTIFLKSANATFTECILKHKNVKKYSFGTGQPLIKSSEIQKMKISLPELEEQEKIGALFEKIDKAIELQEKLVEENKNFKKSMLQKMFPKKGKDIPEIRVSGFKDKWLEKKISYYYEKRDERQIPTKDAPLMAFTSTGGVEDKGERYDRSALIKNKNKKYKRTEKNDLIYSSNNLDVGAISKNSYGTAVISDVYEIFKDKGNADNDFFENIIIQKPFINKMLRYRQGALYGQYRIYAEDFLNIMIRVPPLLEQKAIGLFFKSLDKKIELEDKKLENYKTLKKALLQKMFI